MTVENSSPFAGKKVFITGAGREFGRTLAINFARLGADLLLSAGKIENAGATETIIRSTQPAANIACFPIDLADERQLAGARAEIEGFTDRIDILIHNADFWLRDDFVDTPDDDIVSAVASTATGPFILTKHLVPMIQRSSAATVVFLNGTTTLALVAWDFLRARSCTGLSRRRPYCA